MKYLVSGAVAALVASSPVMAADLVPVEPAPAIVGVPVYDWSGFYIGIGGGHGAVVHDVTSPIPFLGGANFNGIGGEGIFGELTVGYDFAFNNGFVLGAQVNGRYGNIETSIDLLGPFIGADVTAEYGFDVIARLGYTVAPNTLAYVLGGYTWQRFETSVNAFGIGIGYDFDESGYVLGLGLEHAIRDNWTVKGEYRYSDYGSHDGGILGVGLINVEPSMHTLHYSLNYRFNGGPSQRTVAPLNYNWTGLKVGVAAGGGGLVHELSTPILGGNSINGIGAEGFLGELNVGYDFEVGSNFVLGIVGAVRTTNIKTELNLPIAFAGTADIEAGTGYDVLARAGYKLGDRTLAYLVGGYTYQEFDVNFPGFGSVIDWDQDGWTIGSGMEVAFSDRITGYAEYRYSQYSGEDFGTGGLLDLEPSSHTVRAGAKFKLF
ncbi:MAG: outer membrane beta-barrel protein [Pseudomonadota bacterium]